MKFAKRNTDKSIETCGVLAGSLVSYINEKSQSGKLFNKISRIDLRL